VSVYLSLSVRIAEGFFSKEVPTMPLDAICQMAASAGYSAICLRASQVGIQTPLDVRMQAVETLRQHGLSVSMVTGDFPIVYNNDQGPLCLQNIEPYLDLAGAFQSPLIRVALKRQEQIDWAREAAKKAADRGICLVHQCHTRSLFETLDSTVRTLEQIDHPNFGLIFEAANLELCGEPYGIDALRRCKPWLRNVYLQNHKLHDRGDMQLETWVRGKVRFQMLPIHEPGGIDFAQVSAGLRDVSYAGPVTVHQAATAGTTAQEMTSQTAAYLRKVLTDAGMSVASRPQ